MTTIPLPFGGCIQTDGITYQSGAYLHILDHDGEITFRAIHQEFQNQPIKTMEKFLNALEEFVPNKSQKEGQYCFYIEDAILKGSAKQIGVYETQNPKTPLIEYNHNEWKENSEEVIGALINCLEIQSNQSDTEHRENNEDEY